jgi:hypothetical protein
MSLGKVETDCSRASNGTPFHRCEFAGDDVDNGLATGGKIRLNLGTLQERLSLSS